MRYIKTLALTLMLTMFSANYSIATPSANDELAIQHLINFMRDSKLTFIRNGQEGDANAAAEHISDKYNQLKPSIQSAEDFIDKAASKSMLSGQRYLLKFPDGNQKPVAEFLRDELRRYRGRNR